MAKFPFDNGVIEEDYLCMIFVQQEHCLIILHIMQALNPHLKDSESKAYSDLIVTLGSKISK